jgi:hypothetical protein
MRKLLIVGIILFGAFAFAGQAAAGTLYQMSLWGASAQYQLYLQSLSSFLQNAPYSCGGGVVEKDDGSKFAIFDATGCNGLGDEIIIRLTSKASYDGVLALAGTAKAEDIAYAGTAYNSNAQNFCSPADAWPAASQTKGVMPDCCPGGNPIFAGDTCSGNACNYYYRVMYNSTSKDFGCFRVDLALSDVYSTSFTEAMDTADPTDTGFPTFGGNPKTFDGSTNVITQTMISGFTSYNPLVVPFGFYASTDVYYYTCSGGASAGQQCGAYQCASGANAGQDCTPATATAVCGSGVLCNLVGTAGNSYTFPSPDCPAGYVPCTGGQCVGGATPGATCTSSVQCLSSSTEGNCVGAPLSNLSREMAIMIFTKQATYWSDLGKGYASGDSLNYINTCFRVPGSGTDATLNNGILKWKSTTFNGKYLPSNSLQQVIFNDGTTDMMKCINNGSGSANKHGSTQIATAGLIGYADCDQALDMYPLYQYYGGHTDKWDFVNPLKFEGVQCSRRAIRNGEYDNFYSKEWVFQDQTNATFNGNNFLLGLVHCPAGSGTCTPLSGLMDVLSQPSSISSTDRKDFWAAYSEINGAALNGALNQEMHYMKSGNQVNDTQYPVKVTPHSPQNP